LSRRAFLSTKDRVSLMLCTADANFPTSKFADCIR